MANRHNLDFYIESSLRDSFFRDDTIIKGMDKGTVRALSLAAGKIRKTARRHIRKARAQKYDKKNGFPLPTNKPPPNPPKYHTRELPKNIRNIQYGILRQTNSFVIGPMYFPPSLKQSRALPKETVPEILEKGGTFVLTIYRKRLGYSFRQDRFSPVREYFKDAKNSDIMEKKITQTRKPRPFMGPALEKNIDYIPRGFEGILQ
jgi:hypothetical protein